MNAAALYPLVLHLHMSLAGATGIVFALRGAGVLAGHGWPMARPLRWTSMAIDTALLGAGITLWTLLGLAPWRDLWLGSKLVLLFVYIGLGSFALRRAPTRRARAGCFVLALAAYAQIVATALTHDPRGLLRLLS
ncbi:MAG: SirB2 family protein [Burkholderiales bacterium]|nr:SirB2 family protein [Burkholderiales bacterium]MDE2455683.1 SirB2 family protein [Burkholderiales bacterium]